MLTEKIDSMISNIVATIGVKSLIQKEVGTISWSWNDYDRQMHTKKFNYVLYFPDSPVKILSSTSLAEYMKDYEGTWVLTK